MTKCRLTQRAPDPWESTRTVVVGVCAFSSGFRGSKLIPAKWRSLVRPPAGNANRWATFLLQRRYKANIMSKKNIYFIIILVSIMSACANQQSTGLFPTAFPSPLPYIQGTLPSPQPVISQTQYPTLTLKPTEIFTATPPLIENTPTFSPTLTPLPALKPNQTIPLVGIYMMDELNGWGIGEGGYIVHTNDGAISWDDVTPPQGAYNEQGFFAFDGQTAWATPYGEELLYGDGYMQNHTFVWVTQDGGDNWKSSEICLDVCLDITNGISNAYWPESMRFIDQLHGWLVISSGLAMNQDRYNIFYTENGGVNWEFVITSTDGPWVGSITGLEPLDKQNIIMASWRSPAVDPTNDLFYDISRDGGKTWDEYMVFTPPTNPIGNSIWGTLDCGVLNSQSIPPHVLDLTQQCYTVEKSLKSTIHYHSTDGGQTWHYWQQTGDVSFINDKIGWQLVTRGDNAHELQQTHDGGQTWSAIKTVEWDGKLNFINEQIGWALAYKEANTDMAVIFTADGGKTWRILTQASILNPPCLATWSTC
jgi:photosystem II stability/assembly factor-like uncharacterized protein